MPQTAAGQCCSSHCRSSANTGAANSGLSLNSSWYRPSKHWLRTRALGAAAAAATTGPVDLARLTPQPIPEDVKARIRAAQAKYRTLKQPA